MKKMKRNIVVLLLFMVAIISPYFNINLENNVNSNKISYEISNIPEYSGEIYIELNNNKPEFNDTDMSLKQDYYSDLENGRVRNGYDKNKLEKVE